MRSSFIFLSVVCAFVINVEGHRFGYSTAEQRLWKKKHNVIIKIQFIVVVCKFLIELSAMELKSFEAFRTRKLNQ